ncbi:MAG: hypothetical protein E6J29_10605 [Chloroflexi bacterium]|nr:MAG: hypothetical protein E6J29_10605 [Chloroflexota bacterium]TMD55818.1 MAG: hypothetical protein E6I85_02060 [Chloroflexota bacterium]
MTAVRANQLVHAYLLRLEIELADLPAAKRHEIVDEIRSHIAAERSAMVDESDAGLMNLLDRLGDPAEIAAEARSGEERRLPAAGLRRFRTLEVLTLALMLLAWPVGVVLLWASRAWSTREKVLGTLLPPGGYPGVLLVMSTFHWFVSMADAGPKWGQTAVGAVLFTVSLLLLAAPIGMCVYLATRMRVPSQQPGEVRGSPR